MQSNNFNVAKHYTQVEVIVKEPDILLCAYEVFFWISIPFVRQKGHIIISA